MISIIICSRKHQLDLDFEYNIRNTIGTNFEFVIIDNSDNKYTIFEAYNLGIQRSKGAILCFIHDDILFHSQNWGLILESEFKENPNFALIGIAGTKVKTQFPTGWWDCEDKYKAVNILQHDKGKVKRQYLGFTNDNLQDVLAIDGVFMALRQGHNFLFDKDLKGYHNYDLSLSCKVKANGEKIGVTNKILIEHLSIGKLDKDWFFSIIEFHKKYNKNLQENDSTYSQEIFAGKKYIDHCLFILGKKKGFVYLLLIFKLNTSIKIKYALVRHILNRFFEK